MNTIEHAHAAIISLTQYESANYHGDMDAARSKLLDTMRHIIAITKLTPAVPEYRPPRDLCRPERVCRYLRTLDYLANVLPIPGTNIRHHNHIANAWFECVALCEHHGWMPPVTNCYDNRRLTVSAMPAPEWPTIPQPLDMPLITDRMQEIQQQEGDR